MSQIHNNYGAAQNPFVLSVEPPLGYAERQPQDFGKFLMPTSPLLISLHKTLFLVHPQSYKSLCGEFRKVDGPSGFFNFIRKIVGIIIGTGESNINFLLHL